MRVSGKTIFAGLQSAVNLLLPRHMECACYFGVRSLRDLLDWSSVHEPAARDWWANYWGCAQRNWFQAALVRKAVLIEPTGDFEHFWYGSQRAPGVSDPRFARYLE